jgi:hypothetical protein
VEVVYFGKRPDHAADEEDERKAGEKWRVREKPGEKGKRKLL